MTRESYRKWKKNGNLTLPQATLNAILNDVSEGTAGHRTKRELVEAVAYCSLSEMEATARTRELEQQLGYKNWFERLHAELEKLPGYAGQKLKKGKK